MSGMYKREGEAMLEAREEKEKRAKRESSFRFISLIDRCLGRDGSYFLVANLHLGARH